MAKINRTARQRPFLTPITIQTTSSKRKAVKIWSRLTGSMVAMLSQKGKKLSASATGRMFATLVNDCAARNLVSADTHTFAHRYLDQNPGDLIGLARILGHESLETTKINLRLTADDLAQRVERMLIKAYG